MSKLSYDEINEVIIAALSGCTQKYIADYMGVHPDTIRRAIRKNPERMNMFTKVTNELVALSKPETPLVIIGDLIVADVEITGDLKDGVIYCNSLYSVDYHHEQYNDTPEDRMTPNEFLCQQGMNDDDIGIYKKLRVGKLIVRTVEFDIPSGAKLTVDSKWVLEQSETVARINGTNEFWGYITTEPAKEPEPVKDPEPVKAKTEPEIDYSGCVWNSSNRFISITHGRQTYNCTASHPRFKEAQVALINGDFETAIGIINVESAVKRYVKGHIIIEDGILTYKGVEIRNGLTSKIVKAMYAKENFEKFIPFLENLMLNPSNKAVNRLYDFLEANDIDITDDGYFVAWKRVNRDFTDCYTGSLDNSPGQTRKMDRNLVNEDDQSTCSTGLHVCSKSYLAHFFNSAVCKTVRVKVNPRDVVAIPRDYNNAKMRVCEYYVLEEVKSL